MYLGRQQLGTWLDLFIQATQGDSPAMPDAYPAVKIYRASDGAVVFSGNIPIFDKTLTAWLFRLSVFLNDAFAVGQHSFIASWSVGGNVQTRTGNFEVIAGGNPDGQVLSMYFLHRPQRDQLIWQLESGKIKKGSNPRIP